MFVFYFWRQIINIYAGYSIYTHAVINILRKLAEVKENGKGAISESLVKTDHFKEAKSKLTELKTLTQI